MKMTKLNFKPLLFVFTICFIFVAALSVFGQAGKEIKWLRVGSLRSWYANWGSEIELGRTNNAAQQQDGLAWPAQFRYQDCEVSKAMWIGTTNFSDPISGETYPYKVICVGPRHADPNYQFIPVEFKMIGKFSHPTVVVDNLTATDNALNDVVDEIDPNLKADRMIINKLNTEIGITVTRKLMAFSQPNHDNYFIYDYVFKNTGIYDVKGNVVSKTLTGVYFYFLYRYGTGEEAFKLGWYPSNNINWGRNTVNDVVWEDPTDPTYKLRAEYSWYGPHSKSKVDDWGCPNPQDGRLGGVQYMGNVVLHADKSPADHSDDVSQPSTTMYVGSDSPPTQAIDQFNSSQMTDKYLLMSAGHPDKTHAEEVGDGFADLWGTDPGGYSQGEGFGPYTLEPGDSIHIVIAEGVAGISRRKSMEVGKNWYEWYANVGQPTLILPDGSTTTDEDEYKRLWVQTGVDSIFRTFRRAINNYENGYDIPQPPQPPPVFQVKSGGDKIMLSWDPSPDEGSPTFDGYQIFRAIGRPDTLYDKIFSCDKSNIVHSFADKTARRGFNYYYYIQSKDDGSTNDFHPGVPLVSSKFYTMTNTPAYLRKPAVKTTLDSIRVVPNPYDIRARMLQFERDAPDRLAFFGLPPECTIKIYTERGDLIKTIQHTDGTGDELWDSTTSSGQIVVSGLYIAYFETPDGRSIYRKFIIIR